MDVKSSTFWKKEKKTQIEIGRCFRFNSLPLQFCMIFLSLFSVKYNVTNAWRSGLVGNINIKESKFKVLCEWELDKRRISVRVFVNVDTIENIQLTSEVWEGLTNLLNATVKYFPQIKMSFDILCPHCLSNDVNVDGCFCVTYDEICQTLSQGSFQVNTWGHLVSFVLNCWDVLVKRLSRRKKPIDYKDVQVIRTLTRGSSSDIMLCQVKGIDEEVVVKKSEIDIKGMVMNGDDFIPYYIERVEDFLRECEFIRFPECPYIARIHGYCLSPLCVVMEYFNGGSLFDYITTHPKMPWSTRLNIAVSIAKGMTLLIGQKIPMVHRDLKSPNVILKVNGSDEIVQVSITDFGQSMTTFDNNYKTCHSVECPFWLAPEVIKTSQFELESDVYSYGMILWELSTLSAPFPQFKFMEEVRSFINNGNLLEIPQSPYSEFDSLIADCWKEPKGRPSFAAIVVKLMKVIKKSELQKV
ncbi:tyrosine protein kinase, putative [Entamoeba invadens IP1]|uniref:Tyrosine protein kinase, putative n=1 Tax=Entamoeba invadens IP1 TaxID=370355 RepID=A0A0A1TXE1_ENTIV|nr:tyrosine protein kinase, putative [Entamoeba invadens IP1]ELP85952.1 tyrosine protein kinase, putative [Entamoeba invadens IP1]|eukprot:XP_004185298.1 tyrosine protein kinase, putative [Entamoeba invadens IP1]